MKSYIPCFLILLMFGCFSCNSIRTISFEQLYPAEVSFPKQVSRVAVVNNAPPAGPRKKGMIALGEQEGDGKLLAEALAGALADSRYFEQVIICDSALYAGEGRTFLPHTLSKAEVEELTEAMDVDALLSVERVRLEIDEKEYSYPDMPVIFSALEAKVTPVVNVYVPSRERPATSVIYTDSLYWDISPNLSVDDVYHDIASFVSSGLSQKLVPYWVQADRIYFDGGSPEMRDAGVYVRENDWEAAAKIWEEIYGRVKSKKQKMYASFNLALAYEMKGDVDSAIQWLKKSQSYLDPNTELMQIMEVYSIQLEEKKQIMSRLSLQMERSNHKY